MTAHALHFASLSGQDRGTVEQLPFRYAGKHRRARLADVLALKARLNHPGGPRRTGPQGCGAGKDRGHRRRRPRPAG